MDSSAVSRPPSSFRIRAILGTFGLLVAATTFWSCRSAAAVFLDLPPASPGSQESGSGQAPQTQETGVPRVPLAQDTVREVPPVERAPSPDSALALLPKAPDGSVDWVEAIRVGAIAPRGEPSGSVAKEVTYFGYDFYFGSFDTLFPHSGHVGWLDCGACHPGIYRTRSQDNTLTSMEAISDGESCGVCHGRVAFGVDVCERCHEALPMPEGRLEPSLGPTTRIARDSTITSTYPRSIFSHGVHRIRFRCSACHAELYPFRSGAGQARMADLQDGAGCGSCHDGRTAFGLVDCTRCHVSEEDPG